MINNDIISQALHKNVLFFNTIKEINKKNVYLAEINYSGDNEKEFINHIYISIGINGDSENFDALEDNLNSFYWITNYSKIYLIHNSLPQSLYITDIYLDILFYSILRHYKDPNDYYTYNTMNKPIKKREELYAFFKIEFMDIVKKNINKFILKIIERQKKYTVDIY